MRPIEVNKSNSSLRADLSYPILVAHQPEFLPWLGNLSKAAMGDVYLILDTVQFVKEVFQNRNKIKIASDRGWQWLTVPTVGGKKKLMNWQDVKINNSIPWKRKHLAAIKTSYARAPFFSEIYPEIEQIYNEFDDDRLIEFVVKFIEYAHRKFELNIPIYRTSQLIDRGYDISGAKTDLILSMCRSVDAKTFIFGTQGRNYIEKEKFNQVEYRFQNFEHPIYMQQHGDFISHMSFIDVLFNYGPNAKHVLNKSSYDEE